MSDPRTPVTEFLLDSAVLEDVAAAVDLGFVSGLTTNPTLAAAAGLGPPAERVPALLEALPSGPVYHQVEAETDDGADAEIRAVRAVAPDRIVLKLPATPWHYRLAARLTAQGVAVSMTAVYTPSQVLLAAAVGARSVICYVDRAARLRQGGEHLVAELAAARAAGGGDVRIIAASVKSPPQVTRAVLDGADAVTAPLEVLRALAVDELTEQALDGFRRSSTGA
ncbi:MAG: transaldolase family protein [Nitriliruptoraceae bacterium]